MTEINVAERKDKNNRRKLRNETQNENFAHACLLNMIYSISKEPSGIVIVSDGAKQNDGLQH